LWGQEDAGSASICTHMVYTLHRAVVRGVLREKSMSRLSPELAHVGRARTFIALNYERDISLAEVAAAVKLNPSYLSRCFRKIMKQTVVEFIIATRLRAAKSLLAEEPNPPSIKAVAFDTGFKSAAYFCRLFRRYERQTAMEYAARIRAR
jgi:AraC-like DNA-binding protein